MNPAESFEENFERAEDEASISIPFESAIRSHHPHYTISTFERVDYCLTSGQTSLLPSASTAHHPQVVLQQPQRQSTLEGGPHACHSASTSHLPNAPPIGVLKAGGLHSTSRHMTQPAPISDLDRFKLEKKRERNRIAASKCRQRKLERISDLESQVAQLKEENDNFKRLSDRLNTDIRQLKNQIDSHLRRGCHVEGIPLDGVDTTNFQVNTSSTHLTHPSLESAPQQQETNPDSTCLS